MSLRNDGDCFMRSMTWRDGFRSASGSSSETCAFSGGTPLRSPTPPKSLSPLPPSFTFALAGDAGTARETGGEHKNYKPYLAYLHPRLIRRPGRGLL
jgi:hypothetical protein